MLDHFGYFAFLSLQYFCLITVISQSLQIWAILCFHKFKDIPQYFPKKISRGNSELIATDCL